ncbi:MAG: multiple monosaccharide ABC transporter substrate-binding protein [Pseudomonadota bacterium]
MRRRQAVITISAVLVALTSGLVATPAALAADKGLIGISMPTKSLRWVSDGTSMVKVLEEKGYAVALAYAEDDVPNQIAQIDGLVNKGVKVLVVGAVDGVPLAKVLQKAHDKGVKVISYDRLIRGSGNVDFYATFDNFQVGVIQANQIEKALGLKAGKGPFNIELFAGSLDDNNSTYFYNGAMSVLKPYIDKGKLVVRSKQTGLEKIATLRWDALVAQARMVKLLNEHYAKERVDAVLSPYDGISIGVIAALKSAGYGMGALKLPVVTGQDAEIASVKSIARGEQSGTVFKDTRELAKVTGGMVDAIMTGKKPTINNTKTYDNGVKVVPSFLLVPLAVDALNWKEVLLGSGYYTAAQLK